MTPPRTISDGDVLELSDLNLAETAREMVRLAFTIRDARDHGPVVRGRQRRLPGGLHELCDGPGTAPPADPAAVLASAGEFFDPMGRGYTLWTRDHLDGELAAHAQSAGLTRLSDTPGMVLDDADRRTGTAPRRARRIRRDGGSHEGVCRGGPPRL